jgi:hypothetical protein
MDVMFVAMVAVTTIVAPRLSSRGAFGRDDELPRVL